MSIHELSQTMQSGVAHLNRMPLIEAHTSFENADVSPAIVALRQAIGLLSLTQSEGEKARTYADTALDDIHRAGERFAGAINSNNFNGLATWERTSMLTNDSVGMLRNGEQVAKGAREAIAAIGSIIDRLEVECQPARDSGLQQAEYAQDARQRITEHAEAYISDITHGQAADAS